MYAYKCIKLFMYAYIFLCVFVRVDTDAEKYFKDKVRKEMKANDILGVITTMKCRMYKAKVKQKKKHYERT